MCVLLVLLGLIFGVALLSSLTASQDLPTASPLARAGMALHTTNSNNSTAPAAELLCGWKDEPSVVGA